jgi:hypothetical protein
MPEDLNIMDLPLWRNRDFRLLFSAPVISLLGSGVTTVGLALFARSLLSRLTVTWTRKSARSVLYESRQASRSKSVEDSSAHQTNADRMSGI